MDRQRGVERQVDEALRQGDRVGICLPVLCEYRAGIRVSRRRKQNVARLQVALEVLRIWPVDDGTTVEFAELFRELRAAGRMLSQFDLLIAAVARQYDLTLLTADKDFERVQRLRVRNWL
ncbi:MAG: type II toxin-antitoxin system VapC family toxin [Planctomycetia bacterium]|nr:type II toxin-antitoxin system VapC family toxin [Planctomycetia bacterium]